MNDPENNSETDNVDTEQYTVPEAGRLDVIVAAIAEVSRSQAKSWLDAGAVRINGVVVTKASTALRGGETLTFVPPEVTPSEVLPENIPLTVVYEDAH